MAEPTVAAPSLRDRIARALFLQEFPSAADAWDAPGESGRVRYRRGADAVLAVLADADPTDLGMERTGTAWLTVPGVCNHGSWDHCLRTDHKVRPFYARPRPEETP